MKIYFNDKEIDLPVADNSYRYRAIKGEHSLTLYYSLPQHIEIPIGAYCTFEGEVYTLEKPENFTMHNTRNFEYTLVMDSPQAKLSKYKFRDVTSRKLKFSLTAKPEMHLQMLVDNLNQRESGWTVGECVDTSEKVISYNHAFCMDALSQMADEFETEWEVVGKQINLRKVEYNKDNPLALSYGRGNGFKSGVGRANDGDSKPIEILFVQGGERNINASEYGSSELLLPKNQTLEYEGRTYISDSDGFSIRRADKPLTTGNEDSLDCSNIYPSRVGDVTSVVVVNADKHFYDFIDNTIPSDLNFEDCLIEGETMTAIFQSGMLTGKEFEMKYIHKDRRFEIVPQEIDGRTMPDEVFAPVLGDKYAVFGMSLPDAYVCNNADQTGASWDMFREASKYLYENEDQKFTFTGELDGIWAKKDWNNIGGRIKLGGYILFSDNQFQPEGVAIRIVGVKDYINNPHSPVIELSNSVVGSSIRSDLRKIETSEVIIDNLHKDALQFTKRRFRDAKETMSMLEDALLENFTNSISPITVQTMSMLVGDESLQFRFVNDVTTPETVAHNVVYDKKNKILTSPAGIIQHMTLGINAISSSHAVDDYRFWSIPKFNTPALIDSSKKYYLYARVSTSEESGTGTFYISEKAIGMTQMSGYYHLLMGVLNSEYEGDRSYVSLYGFTEILPGRITTDKIVSSSGLNYIDFLNNAARIGNNKNYIDFNSEKDGKLRLKGTLIQSESGEENYIGVFRGTYNASYTYYQSDEVTYTLNGVTSTYRYTNPSPSKGNAPTDATYWQVIAQGVKGSDGKNGSNGMDGAYYVDVYRTASSQPGTPTGSTIPPSGWSLTPTAPSATNYTWMSQTKVSNTGSVGAWSTPIRISGFNGKDGEDGNEVEFIYARTKGEESPATPSTSQNDDYVPSGWSDNPQGVTAEYTNEWVSTRDKKNGAWGSFSIPAMWSRWSERGRDGDGFEYIYIRTVTDATPSTPSTSQNDDYVPSGWSDDPQGVSASYPYEWVCVRKRGNGVWSGFSSPALWAKWSKDGSNGDFYEYRYAKNGSRTSPPDLSVTSASPSGWSTNVPAVGSLEYLWWTVSKKTAAGVLLQNWSTPVRATGYDGSDGEVGPVMLFRGDYSSTKTYYGTSKRVDAVKYNNTYYVARSDAGDGFANKVPTDTNYWNSFGAQFESVATSLLLAEEANIAGFIFRNNKLESQETNSNGSPTLVLDGINGVVYGSKGVWSGSIWYEYITLKDGETLNPLNPNVRLVQSSYESDIVYLPDITSGIVGAAFNIYWDGVGTRNVYSSQEIRSRSANIIDFDYVGASGIPVFKSKINCSVYGYGFLQIICVSESAWVVVLKSGDKISLS